MRRGAPRAHPDAGRLLAALAGVVLVALLTACGNAGAGATRSTPQDTPLAAAPSAPAPAPSPVIDVDVHSSALTAPVEAVPPVRLRVAALGIDMPVTDVGLDPTGAMELAPDPGVAGWYRYGPDALSTKGTVVVAAHVDAPGYPIGPLSRLRDAAPGSPVEVVASDGSTRTFVVESVTMYDKTTLPLGELFARDGEPALAIITCGGPFDSATGHYRDNVVAIARMP